MGKPILERKLASTTFLQNYYLKQELVNFCRQEKLSCTGNKETLTFRISAYLDGIKNIAEKNEKSATSLKLNTLEKNKVANTIMGSANKDVKPSKLSSGESIAMQLTLNSLIEPNFVCSEKHRAFFKAQIGQSFHFFVAFQNWLKANTGKTYREAVHAYQQLKAKKKTGGVQIGKQFEYNRYIHDFFEENQGLTLEQAIICWKAKKDKEGLHIYEHKDLEALNQ